MKGETFPKTYPLYYLNPKDRIKKYGTMYLGKMQGYYIVEDQYSATRYKNYKDALKHFNENVKIEKKMK